MNIKYLWELLFKVVTLYGSIRIIDLSIMFYKKHNGDGDSMKNMLVLNIMFVILSLLLGIEDDIFSGKYNEEQLTKKILTYMKQLAYKSLLFIGNISIFFFILDYLEKFDYETKNKYAGLGFLTLGFILANTIVNYEMKVVNKLFFKNDVKTLKKTKKVSKKRSKRRS